MPGIANQEPYYRRALTIEGAQAPSRGIIGQREQLEHAKIGPAGHGRLQLVEVLLLLVGRIGQNGQALVDPAGQHCTENRSANTTCVNS